MPARPLRPLRRPGARTALLLGGGAAVALMAFGARAQEGGTLLTFGLSTRLEASDNQGLDPDPEGGTLTSQAALSFALSSTTRTERLELSGSATARAVQGPDEETFDAFADPNLQLSYSRQGANSSLDASASISFADIEFLRPLELIVDDDGEIVIPDDFDDLEGEGTRIARSASIDVTLIEEGPIGVGFGLSASDISYDEASPTLEESRSVAADANFRLKLSDVTDATLALGYSVTESDAEEGEGEETRERRSVTAGLTHDRPRGPLRFRVSVADAENGTRTTVSAGRDFAYPRGQLSFNIGATREADGATNLTGDLRWSYDLANGGFTAALNRDISINAEGDETLRTGFVAGYDRPLTTRASLGLDFAYARSETTAGEADEDGDGGADQSASLTASLGYALTRDWSMTLGASARLEEDDGEEARENAVFVSLGRSFAFRP